ncbi:class I SAM-dependent methyltransferase [Roseovarius aquimarinus]|uniref:Class I SAM-dependent methyltransferase n=1 Tax=Roseovarius aquimarinus TaxID=1229156 RepID=A0ABW7IB59_9RHOB
MRDALRDEFETKDWSGRKVESRSGSGSTLEATEALRAALPDLLKRYKVKRFLDAPCGDWFWMQHTKLGRTHYTGGDISAEVIEAVRAEHGRKNREFVHLDITSDPLPDADMMMCRDCLFHLKWWLRWKFFENFAQSGISFLLTSMHHGTWNKRLRKNGDFAPFNPCAAPFNFPEPLETIAETGEIDLSPEVLETSRGRRQRSMGLWSRAQVIEAVERHHASQEAP